MIGLVLLLTIAFQVFLTYKKVSPFISLLLVALAAGLLLGMEPKALLFSFEKGAGTTLGSLALILCLGAIFGKILEASGATDQITDTILQGLGIRYVQWGILLTGFLVGIPLYYNAGFIILVPLVFSIARTAKLPLLYVAIPMAASLSVTHCFLPPHPGPVVLVNAFHANMGTTLWYGIILAIPIVILGGPLFGQLYKNSKGKEVDFLFSSGKIIVKHKPGVFASFCIAMMPVLLILLAVLADMFLPKGNVCRTIALFIGDSTMALLSAVLMAIYFFGLKTGKKMSEIMVWCNEAVSGIAMILLIITAGGIFKQVLLDSGTATYVASYSQTWKMPPLIFGWLVTAILRVMIGSATVAGLTAAGIVTPLVSSGLVLPELMVLAVGAGSVFGSHINDTGFWMFKEFFKLTLKQTFFSWTLMETIISVSGLIGVLMLDFFLG